MKRLRQFRGGYRVSGRKDLARELRKEQTAAEQLLWETIRNCKLLGFKFRRQHQIGEYIADFYCHEAQLLIECDGTVHDGDEAWQHDQKRDSYLVGQGLRVLRLRNDEVVHDTAAAIEKISSYLRKMNSE
jgi:type I restriction enzyme R subunit